MGAPAGGPEVPDELDVPDRHLAARPQHGLRGQPVRPSRPPTAARRGATSAPTSRSTTRASWATRAASPSTTSASSTHGVVFAIAESPKEKGVIWAGTNDGLVQVTRDGGKTWTNVTANITGLPPKLARSAASSRRGSTPARLLHRGGRPPGRRLRSASLQDHRLRPHVEEIVQGIPHGPLSYTHVRARGSEAQGPALRRHRERRCTCRSTTAERWTALQLEPAARARALARRAAALPRPRGRHVRPRHLDPGRPHAAAAAGPGASRHMPAHLFAAAARLPLPRPEPPRPGARRPDARGGTRPTAPRSTTGSPARRRPWR